MIVIVAFIAGMITGVASAYLLLIALRLAAAWPKSKPPTKEEWRIHNDI